MDITRHTYGDNRRDSIPWNASRMKLYCWFHRIQRLIVSIHFCILASLLWVKRTFCAIPMLIFHDILGYFDSPIEPQLKLTKQKIWVTQQAIFVPWCEPVCPWFCLVIAWLGSIYHPGHLEVRSWVSCHLKATNGQATAPVEWWNPAGIPCVLIRLLDLVNRKSSLLYLYLWCANCLT